MGRMRMRSLGIAAVAVVVAFGAWLISPSSGQSDRTGKTIEWEYLEGQEGSDLQRLQLPKGWLVENADGYLVVVNDPDHRWLRHEDEE